MNIEVLYLLLSILLVVIIEAANNNDNSNNKNNGRHMNKKAGAHAQTNLYKLVPMPMKKVMKKGKMNKNKKGRKNWRKNFRPSQNVTKDLDIASPPCVVNCPDFRCADLGNGVTAPAGPLVGTTKTACGKRYFVSNVEQTFQGAGVACCDLGMTLVSLETRGEFACVTAMVKESPGVFWTAGSDRGCDGDFLWCDGSEETFSSDAAWMPGAPSTQDTFDEHCVTLNIPVDNAKNLGLDDDHCDMFFRYICEVPAEK